MFYFDGMFAVKKYELLLLQLVKHNMHETNTHFHDEFLLAIYFHIKCAKKYLKKKSEIASISMLHCASFLGTLQFYNRSFAI